MLIKNKSFKPFVGPRKIPSVPPSCLSQAEKTVTDWAYFSKFVKSKGELGHRQYAAWTTRRGAMSEAVRDEFRLFRHEYLYEISIRDIMSAVSKSDHSLGELKKSCEKYKKVEDWSPNVPFVYLFHVMLERFRKIPTWQDAWAFFEGELANYCWTPFCEHYHMDPAIRIEGVRKEDPLLIDAFQWRMGAAYYSFIREIHYIASIRQNHGIDLKYHFALDAEWRIDFIAGEVLIELFVENKRYKTRDDGRKVRCWQMNPGYKVVDITINQEWIPRGKPYLIPAGDIAANARTLIAAGCPTISSHAKAA